MTNALSLSLFRRLCAIAIGVGSAVATFAVLIDQQKLERFVAQNFSNQGLQNVDAWRDLLAHVQDRSVNEKLKRVNEFFNRRIRWKDDSEVWQLSDYWATPGETMGKGAGDCEDFAIAKYYSLLNLGIPAKQLRMIYVRALTGNGAANNDQQAHMVMAFYEKPTSEPLILDNLISDIRPASRRPDLIPIFSFNGENIFDGVSGESAVAQRVRLSRWQDLMQRARSEGFLN